MTEDQTIDVPSTRAENASTEVQNQNELMSVSDNAFKIDKKTPKRKKFKKLTEDAEVVANDNDDNKDENVMPAPPPSKRQKRRQKRQQLVTRTKDKEIEKTITYLTKWYKNRDEWKYEKLRQIYIQKNIFDETIISNEHSEVAIKYLATSKGHSREVIIKAAETIIKETEDQITDENQEELISSCRYERARSILQIMQD